jgi:isoquinoline 1-oxidoreductase subunit alpha
MVTIRKSLQLRGTRQGSTQTVSSRVRGCFEAGASTDPAERGSRLGESRLSATWPGVTGYAAGLEALMIKLTVNGTERSVEMDPETPLLWVLRDGLGLTGTKYGCGIAQCGACTVHVDGIPKRACCTPAAVAIGKQVITIEGLSAHGDHPVQRAWSEVDVVQCGYCQSGQIMAAAALLKARPQPTDSEIDAALSGNLCRCGTYQRIRAAVHRAAELGKGA